ncbi:hypothetical protein AMECASPLE_012183 [Ameca splendens]|uniref:Uncharacterized protein n=1 Tax=Ameca splendens TaxID=208324 RepID=A0ABV1A7S0_9TELE
MCKLSEKVGQHMRKKSTGCKYACHAECRERVSLDCHPAASPFSQDLLNNNRPLHVSKKCTVHEVMSVYVSSCPCETLHGCFSSENLQFSIVGRFFTD